MKWQLVVAGLVFGVSLVGQSAEAQDPPVPTGESKPKAPNRVEQRAQSMRDQIENGRTVQSHVRVAVRLKNGNRLVGVVKDGKMVERVDGLRFVEAQALERGAGIRLWYTGGTRNFVFVPFGDFADYEVLQQLSNKQLAAIEQEMQMNERRAGDRQAATPRAAEPAATPAPADAPAPAATPGNEPPTPPDQVEGGKVQGQATAPATAKPGTAGSNPARPGATPAAAAAKSELEQQREWFALLQAYPPTAGWNRARRDEIARRKVVVGANPNEAEKNFVAKFEEWLKACAHFKVDPEAKPAESSEDVSADDRPSPPKRKKDRQQDRQ